ncbi:MAG: type II toxin-antitoxin system HicA family toxin [Planctomycetes bacterium]|nr:type II toxin-antitoxin system HicA family toxin [Planctomycetota bacterium]
MPVWGPVSRRQLIRAFRALGFEGPLSGGRHEFMARGQLVVAIPNPHAKDIGVALLSRVLKQAGVTRTDWERV